ncbi:MAG TPA: hypothetical protein PKC42_02060 [Candidatus Nanoperiomorbaceae bacterium]|nr:hypothetical protein [Candidatus Nanoperiomorbaceae bacterium]
MSDMNHAREGGITCEVTVVPGLRAPNLFHWAPIGMVYDINVQTSVAKAALLSGGDHTDMQDYLTYYKSRIHHGDPDIDYRVASIRTFRVQDEGEEYIWGQSGIIWENGDKLNPRVVDMAHRATQALVLLNSDFEDLPRGEFVREFTAGELATAPDQHIIYELDAPLGLSA